jgi:hypothetical protein
MSSMDPSNIKITCNSSNSDQIVIAEILPIEQE